jgi:predicted SnoaL-like aldol condensation-catalyzing enzyme
VSNSGQNGGTMKNTFMVISLVFLLCIIAGCQQGAKVVEQPVLTQTEEERTNLETYRLWDEEVWGNGKLELVKELVAPEYIMHEARSDWVVTPEQYTEEIREYQKNSGSRDFVGKTQAISAKDDLVWVRSSGVATDPKDGNKGSVKVLKVYRFVNGKLTESWAIVINDQGPWPDFKR